MTRGWTAQDVTRHQLKQAQKQTKPSKYHNVKTLLNGMLFDSKHEADVYQGLLIRQQAGQIRELRRQVPFQLCAPDSMMPAHLLPGALVRVVEVAIYVADAVYIDNIDNSLHVIDAKGQRKRICPYPLKKKWMALQYGIEIEEV